MLDERPRQSRKIPYTSAAVLLSVAATRGRPLLCLWGSRSSRHCDLTDGKAYYDPETFFDGLPVSTRQGVYRMWPEACAMMRERLGVNITDKRVTYLSNQRGPRRIHADRDLREITDRVTGLEPTKLALADYGFASVESGAGLRLPYWLDYLTPARRKRNRDFPGCVAADRIGENVDHLYRTCVRMRRPGGFDMVYAYRNAAPWPKDERGTLSARDMLRGLNLAPEIWIRRRIARKSSVISLSIFGTREDGRGRWEIVDITPIVALYAANVDPETPVLWRRAVYLVDRGDNLEWIILHPAHDRMEYIAGTPAGSGIADEHYEGSPARTIIASLTRVFGTALRVRWILDDTPLKDAGEVR
jgi:hypothetical protein